MITVLTVTGMRPEAFAKCEEYMLAQDYTDPVLWVIVDDGATAQPITFKRGGWELVVIRPEPFWKPGENTQARNLLAGLGHCTDRIVIIEDDDQYHSEWLSRCDRWLDDHDLVGEGQAVYRNVNSGNTMEFNNMAHCSLCSTAVKGPAVEWLGESAEAGRRFIDMRMWKLARAHFMDRCKVHPNTGGVCGLKGGPGRPGIASGHI